MVNVSHRLADHTEVPFTFWLAGEESLEDDGGVKVKLVGVTGRGVADPLEMEGCVKQESTRVC